MGGAFAVATDPKEPYGDVEYADGGLQPDGKKRYPLDNEQHCRSAWAFVNMPENAAKYTPEQLAAIKAKIRAALKRYGVEVEASAADPPPDEPPVTDPQAPAAPGASSCPAPVTAAEAMRRVHAATTKTTATTAEERGAGHMDPAKIREALGLAPDVSDDEVKAAVAAAYNLAPPADPAPVAKPVPIAAAAGTMVIDVSAWEEQQGRIKRLEASQAKAMRDERDKVIEQAVKDGKFAPARKDHWVKIWDADPESARAVIDGLTKNVVPVMAMGYAGGAEGESDFEHEYQQLVTQLNGRRG